MPDDITDRFFHWMEANNIKRSTAAGLLDVDERSLSTYRSRGLPQKKHARAEQLMAGGQSLPGADQDDNKISIAFTDEEFDLVQRAAAIVQTRFKDFIRRATIAKAEEEIRREKSHQKAQPLRVEHGPITAPASTGTDGK